MASSNICNICTCGICLESFNKSSKCPRILSCGHSFCNSCLEKLLLGQNPCCHTCKAEILFKSTETIPINFSLGNKIFISNSTQTGGPVKGDKITGSRKYLSEGYCNEHEHFKEMRCMDCEVWICGLCWSLQHKHCRALLVKEAYKELKKKVSQRVEEELGQRMAKTKQLTESLRYLEEERNYLIEVIKESTLKLKRREKRIQELESLISEEDKFSCQLAKIKTKINSSLNLEKYSRTLKELEKLLQEVKIKIPVELSPYHLPQTRESLGTLCLNRSVYAMEDRYDGRKYGLVALKDGNIYVASCQQQLPEDAVIFALSELLSRFNNGSSELPKTAFFRVKPDRGRVYSFEVIIKTENLTPRAKNFIFLCSALMGPSYKGIPMNYLSNYACYQLHPAPPPVVVGIRDDDQETLVPSLRKKGVVYGMWESDSWFWIQLKDQPSYSKHQLGVVVAGLLQLEELGGNRCSIEECGLMI